MQACKLGMMAHFISTLSPQKKEIKEKRGLDPLALAVG